MSRGLSDEKLPGRLSFPASLIISSNAADTILWLLTSFAGCSPHWRKWSRPPLLLHPFHVSANVRRLVSPRGLGPRVIGAFNPSWLSSAALSRLWAAPLVFISCPLASSPFASQCFISTVRVHDADVQDGTKGHRIMTGKKLIKPNNHGCRNDVTFQRKWNDWFFKKKNYYLGVYKLHT